MGDGGGAALHCPFRTAKQVARGVWESIGDDDVPEPWALTLARHCYDLPSSTLAHLPYSGGVWEQPEELLHLIGIARRAWYVWQYKPANEIKLNIDDADFIAWALGDNDGTE